MRHTSKRRAVAVRLYVKKRAEFLTANPGCWRCLHRATDVHHMAGRRGDALLDDTRWAALCRDCHRLVTENPKWAIENGWSLSRVGRNEAS